MPAQRISEFDLWQPGYAGAVVRVYIAGGTTLASIYTDEALSVAASNPQTPTLTAALVAGHLVLLVGNSLVEVGLEGHKLLVALHSLQVLEQVVSLAGAVQDTGVGMAAIHLLVPFTALVAVALALLLGQTPRTQPVLE